MVYAQPNICPGEYHTHKLLWDFDIQTDHLFLARRLDLIIINNNNKKITCRIVDFAVPADHRVKLKEREKKDKYLDFARELKKLRNMLVTFIPIVFSSLGTVPKGLIKGLEDLDLTGRVETIQTTALLRSTKILRRVMQIWGNLLALKLQWKENYIAFSQEPRLEDSQDWRTVKSETDKVNDLLTNIPTSYITELNDLIYAGAKLVCEKMGVLLKTTDRKSKPGWELRLESQIKRLRLQARIRKWNIRNWKSTATRPAAKKKLEVTN